MAFLLCRYAICSKKFLLWFVVFLIFIHYLTFGILSLGRGGKNGTIHSRSQPQPLFLWKSISKFFICFQSNLIFHFALFANLYVCLAHIFVWSIITKYQKFVNQAHFSFWLCYPFSAYKHSQLFHLPIYFWQFICSVAYKLNQTQSHKLI